VISVVKYFSVSVLVPFSLIFFHFSCVSVFANFSVSVSVSVYFIFKIQFQFSFQFPFSINI